MATPPFIPQEPVQGQSSTNAIPGAATDASRMAIQIIQQATQGAQNPIQSRPQVILPQPRVPQQIPMGQPTNQVQATTQAGQRRNDMQSLISSVGNVVKAGVNKKRQKDEQSLMHNLAVIQSAASNPDDPHNKLILDQMMNDPKVVKQLQKALGYNPLSGEEAPPEAKTLQKFGAQLQAKQAIGQQGQGATQTQQGALQVQQGSQPGQGMRNLMSRMPNTQQINPVVAMQAELIKAGILPKNDMTPKALLDFVQEAMKDDTKREEIKARAEATNNQSLMRLYDTLVKADAMMKRGRERDTSQERQTHEKAQAYKYGADQRFAAAEKHAMASDPTFKNLKIASDAYDKDIQRTEEQLSTLLKQKSTGTQEKGVNLDEAIMLKKQELDKFKSLKGTMTDMMRDRLKVEPASGGVDNLLQQDTPKEEDMQFGDYVFGAPQPQQ